MSPSVRTLAEEMIRFIQINRTTLNGLDHGTVTFNVYRGTLVEATASETVKLTASAQLCPLSLKSAESE